MLEIKVGLVAGTVLSAGAVVVTAAQQFNEPAPIGLYIAFGSLLMAAVGVLLALLRAMSGYGREQGQMLTAIEQLKQQQASQISASEVKLMMENLTLKIDALSTRVHDWTGTVTYDLRRLRESSRHSTNNDAQREESRKYLEREEHDTRREDLR